MGVASSLAEIIAQNTLVAPTRTFILGATQSLPSRRLSDTPSRSPLQQIGVANQNSFVVYNRQGNGGIFILESLL